MISREFKERKSHGVEYSNIKSIVLPSQVGSRKSSKTERERGRISDFLSNAGAFASIDGSLRNETKLLVCAGATRKET